jgi:hypothetical protein
MFRDGRKWDRYYLYVLLAFFILGCITSGCAGLPPSPEDAEAIECLVKGGDWVDGKCTYPDPTPTPTPEPTPTPTPDPVESCSFPQGIPDQEFTGLPVSSVHAEVVNEVMAEITGCKVGSRCVHKKSPQEFMQLVVVALRERGLCAGQHITGRTDEIAVSSDCEGVWEGYHITTWAAKPTVVWSPGSHRPAYKIPPSYCTINHNPPPPIQLDCPDPVPDVNSLRLDVKYHGRNKWDLTPKLINVCRYCDDIGMGYHGGEIRCSCPVRPEGHVDRSACEQFVLGGDPRWFCNNQEVESTANPYQAVCVGDVKACNSDLSICSQGVR